MNNHTAFLNGVTPLKKAAQVLNVERVLCCTATATTKVSKGILSSFNIPSRNLFCTNFYRENLHLRFESVTIANKNTSILKRLKEDLADGSPYKGSGIVYITTQNQATDLQNFLRVRDTMPNLIMRE